MPITIKEIKNLTTGKLAVEAELTKFDSQTGFADKVTAADVTAASWADFAAANDNIQVTWQGEGDKLIARGVGGRFTIKDGKTITISGLKDASKYSAEVSGELAIGPKDGSKPAALLRIRVGNMVTDTNKSGDTIINFSDKTDSAGGSEINLKVLIDWILENSKDKTSVPELPKIDDGKGGVKKPEDFIIVFKNFYYNITQNTFDFWVESKAGSEITFGVFTIKKAGFRITNMPTAAEVKEAPKALPAPAPAD